MLTDNSHSLTLWILQELDAMAADTEQSQQQEVEEKEALQYWGFLLQENKCGTDLLNRLLTGIAETIVCCAAFVLYQRVYLLTDAVRQLWLL